MANKNTTKEFVHAFTEETLSSEPASLVKVGTNNTYTVSNNRAWYGIGTGVYSLKATGGGSIDHNWAYFNTSMTSGDGYFSVMVNADQYAGDRWGVVFRAHDDSGTERCYAAFVRYSGTDTTLRLSRFADSTETTISTVTIDAGNIPGTDKWYKVEVYADGSTIKARAWDIANEDAPAWQIDTTDANIANTNTGVGVYAYIGANDWYFDHLEARTYDALPNASPANLTEERENVWTSLKDQYVRWDGAIRKDKNTTGEESVSEGTGYFLIEAVNQNDQDTFDLVFQFALDNLAGINNSESWDYLFAWQFDIAGGNTVADWNYASDGDNDILYAVIAAHEKWGSAGTIDYESYITLIAADLYNYTINTQGTLHLQVPYPSELTSTTAEINPSYFRPSLFQILTEFDATRSSEWTQVLADGWTMIDSVTDNSGTLPTTAGLVPNWVNYNTTTNTFGNPTDGSHTTLHGFETVRVYPFFELAADVYSSTDASDYMTGNIATFLNDEYTDHSKIKVEYNHDGTDAPDNDYDLSYFNYGYVFILERASASNASAFRTAKVDNQYTTNSDEAEIAYFGSSGYYGATLNMINASIDDGAFTQLVATCTLTQENGDAILLEDGDTLELESCPVSNVIDLNAGSFTLTGYAASLVVSRVIDLGLGQYTFTGLAAELVSENAISLNAGSFTLTGYDANLIVSRMIDLDSGSFTFSGLDAAISTSKTLQLDAGSFTLAGYSADLVVSRVIDLGNQEFTLTGLSASLATAKSITLNLGQYTFVGYSTELNYSAAPNAIGNIKYFADPSWTVAQLKYWDGTQWQNAALKYWDGGNWQTVEYF